MRPAILTGNPLPPVEIARRLVLIPYYIVLINWGNLISRKWNGRISRELIFAI